MNHTTYITNHGGRGGGGLERKIPTRGDKDNGGGSGTLADGEGAVPLHIRAMCYYYWNSVIKTTVMYIYIFIYKIIYIYVSLKIH